MIDELTDAQKEALRRADDLARNEGWSVRENVSDWKEKRWMRRNGKRWRGFSRKDHALLVERLEQSRRCPEREKL